MNGKVWEGKMSKDLEKVLKNKIIINIKNEEEEGGTVRFISDGQLAKDVYSVNPTLEDLYLYYFN